MQNNDREYKKSGSLSGNKYNKFKSKVGKEQKMQIHKGFRVSAFAFLIYSVWRLQKE